MKKALSLILSALVAFSAFCFGAFAESTAPTVYLTISDNTATLQLKQQPITVTDADSDGALTINDALYIAHEQFFTGGAAAGYGSSDDYGFGLAITKLWGQTNGGSFGYYRNNNMCMNLEEVVSNGDYINAYCYVDATTWSDRYSYFDKNTATVDVGGSVTLKLTNLEFTMDGTTLTPPTPYADITINGAETENRTNEEGNVTLSFDTAGTYYISATYREFKIVPPVCVVTVGTVEEPTPDDSSEPADDETTSSDDGSSDDDTVSSDDASDDDISDDILFNESGVQDIADSETSTSSTDTTSSDNVNSSLVSPQTGESTTLPFVMASIMIVAIGAGYVTLKLNKNEK